MDQITKAQLRRPADVRALLRRCHDKLHARGADGGEQDLTMDVVRLLLAKAEDEARPGDRLELWCSDDELRSERGRDACAARARGLFRAVADRHPDVFAADEAIAVGAAAICDVVVELQPYRILGADDLLGHAYEEYTAAHLKRTRGQFFTQRGVVELMVAMLDPQPGHTILDPAGGSGGFLAGALRYVRTAHAEEAAPPRLFMVEISPRLVKIAQAALILGGARHTRVTRGDGLAPLESLRAACGLESADRVLSNPPFAGVSDGRISDPTVLRSFATGHRWALGEGGLEPTDELLSEGSPPEMLFFERALAWLAPGGRLAIVMPKGFLDTQTYRPARELLFRQCRLLAVINCHKNTFQPHTGVRTCIVFAEKLRPGEDTSADHPIFMAINRKGGQDSEGVPVFRRGEGGQVTSQIDHDLDEIVRDYRAACAGTLVPSAYRFTARRSALDDNLRINPQAHLPHYHAVLARLEAVDELPGWSISTLGQLHHDIEIFKGPRFKSENIMTDEPRPGCTEPYYTPSAVLQERSDGAKYVDTSRASSAQLRAIHAIRVRCGDIVITRSGTIGRVAYIPRRLDGAIVSDDLIRVRVPDERLRLYVYTFLQSEVGLSQMLRNEYGSVQQHLEPAHVADLLIPVPDDPAALEPAIASMRETIRLREELEDRKEESTRRMEALLGELMG